MEELLKELRGLMKAADGCNGIHKKVKDKSFWSNNYIEQIKNGTNPKDDTKNTKEIRRMIKQYETLLHKHVNQINVVL